MRPKTSPSPAPPSVRAPSRSEEKPKKPPMPASTPPLLAFHRGTVHGETCQSYVDITALCRAEIRSRGWEEKVADCIPEYLDSVAVGDDDIVVHRLWLFRVACNEASRSCGNYRGLLGRSSDAKYLSASEEWDGGYFHETVIAVSYGEDTWPMIDLSSFGDMWTRNWAEVKQLQMLDHGMLQLEIAHHEDYTEEGDGRGDDDDDDDEDQGCLLHYRNVITYEELTIAVTATGPVLLDRDEHTVIDTNCPDPSSDDDSDASAQDISNDTSSSIEPCREERMGHCTQEHPCKSLCARLSGDHAR